jgi:predicted alpha/beta hydrolase
MPALSHLMGYFPARFLGLGEDLPKGIALGWARWARTSTYLDALLAGPRGVRGRAYSFSDDILAPKKACDRLCHAYAGVSWERRHIEPASLGVSSVGHFGFFQDRFRDSLWAQSLDWIRATRSVAS